MDGLKKLRLIDSNNVPQDELDLLGGGVTSIHRSKDGLRVRLCREWTYKIHPADDDDDDEVTL